MSKIGHFFAMLWGKVWPAVKVVEPVAGRVVTVIDPKLGPVIVAGETAVNAIREARH
jgi:hypothetical protein